MSDIEVYAYDSIINISNGNNSSIASENRNVLANIGSPEFKPETQLIQNLTIVYNNYEFHYNQNGHHVSSTPGSPQRKLKIGKGFRDVSSVIKQIADSKFGLVKFSYCLMK